jgi:hypothetical protein
VFSWTPGEADGPSDFDITVLVTDDGVPARGDSETFRITVREVNAAPVLGPIAEQAVAENAELSFAITASDPDTPENGIVFSLGMDAPAGSAIDASSGLFTWTPTEAQGPGLYFVTVVATDNGSPALSDEQTFAIAVDEGNSAPQLGAIGDREIERGTALSFTATATDTDVPADGLRFTLAAGAPAGAAIDRDTGLFSWTPDAGLTPGVFSVTVLVTDNATRPLSDSETFAIAVTDDNRAPVLDSIGARNVDEQMALTFTATASDPDGAANTLTFSLDQGAPAGAAIDGVTGLFTWTPSEAQGPGAFDVTVRVSDDGSSLLSDFETIRITVAEVNQAPVIAAIADTQAVNEGTTLSIQATATDPDAPANALTFSLGSGAPAGAAITAGGLFTFTPSEAQGPGIFPVTIVVTDNGTPALSDDEAFTITVGEVNRAPVLGAIGDQTIREGQELTFAISATDADVPTQVLTYGVTGLPGGATFDPATRTFRWTPTEAQGPGVFNGITFSVSDGVDSDSETIGITVSEINVAPAAQLTGPAWGAGAGAGVHGGVHRRRRRRHPRGGGGLGRWQQHALPPVD